MSARRPFPIQLRRMIIAALLLAVALLLPFLTGQIPEIGKMLCPMHLPVLLCGFVCGPLWGGAVGLVSPLLRFLLFGMPQMPTALSMAFELAAYGALTGVFRRLFSLRVGFVYLSLLLSMLGGRLVLAVAQFAIAGFTDTTFSFALYFAGAVTQAIPGILLQLVLIPPIVLVLKRYHLIPALHKEKNI